MTVFHVAPTRFGPDGLYGGGERYPLELARALNREVECMLLSFGERRRDFRDQTGLRVQIEPALAYWRGHPAQAIAPGLPFAMRGAGLVHTHHTYSLPSLTAALSALRGVPVVTTDHGIPGGPFAPLLRKLFAHFLPVSEYSRHTLGVPLGKSSAIYGGADPDRFYPDPAVERCGVLFVGRLTPHKGVDRLIQALPDGATLLIAGSVGHDAAYPESGYPDLLRRLAQGKDVRFLGPVADEELPALMRTAQVLVLPSVQRTCYGKTIAISELLGLVVIEAMASGTPVITSRLGGLPEVVEDGLFGFLVEPGDVPALRDRLAQLLGDQVLARRLGDNARQVALERFTWRACAERCLAAYREVARL